MKTHLMHPTRYSVSRYTGIKYFETMCGKTNLATVRDRQAVTCQTCLRVAQSKYYKDCFS